MFSDADNPATIALHSVPDGVQGVFVTMRAMRDFVLAYRLLPRVRQIAIAAIRRVPPKDTRGELSALFSWVRSHVRYTPDILDVETLSTPLQVIRDGAGDCDDLATLLAALCESVGIRTRFKLTGYQNGHEFEHVYLEALIDGEWIPCDVTEFRNPGAEVPFKNSFVERI